VKCRILYVVGQLGAGGLERQLYLLLRTMDRDRYGPEVVVWNFREEDTYVNRVRELGLPLHFFPSGFNRMAKMLAFRRLVNDKKPELIHSYSFHTNFAAWWAALGNNTLPVGATRSDFMRDKKSCGVLLGSLCARWPSTHIYNNLKSAERARACRSVFAPKDVLVVRNGLDLAEFRPTPVPMSRRVRIVGIGSLLPDKRWDRLVTAALALKNMGFDILVDLAGGGPLRESLAKDISELGLADRFKLTGHIDDVPAVLGTSTFLAHTSDVEGCPNVVMEAMACGRAVVATDVGDVPSLVEHGKTGFVVPRADQAALIDRLAALASNRDLCCKMGEAGRVKAEREFGADRLVNETIAAYSAAGWKERCSAWH
jgi:glycosyltransferase involved in cell wall biosynthesis